MIKKNILGLLFLLSALCLFNSCEDDPYYDDYGWATDALCNNTWVDFYTNNKGYECEQRLDFYNDHTGEDFTIIYYPNGMTDELKTSFYWDWKDEYFDSFYVEYANGTDYYEDVRIGNEYLKWFPKRRPGDLRGIPLVIKKAIVTIAFFIVAPPRIELGSKV